QAGSVKLFDLSYSCTSGFTGIAVGSDGRIWFDGFNDYQHCRGGAVGSISTTGAAGPGTCCNSNVFSGIAAGPDHAMWAGDTSPYDSIWRVTPGGSVQQFTIPNNGTSTDPIARPDGRVWFVDNGQLAAITTAVS